MAASAARGEVRVANVFGDRMVLPRNQSIPIWGWAEAGESVVAEFGEQRTSATADAQGKWTLELAPLGPSATSRVLKITGTKTAAPIVFRDVLVGEVWLASGQSNMATGAGPEAAAADTPLVRFTAVESFYPGTPAAVSAPVAVRYAWVNAPAVSLYDRAGVPIAPFRTDDRKP